MKITCLGPHPFTIPLSPKLHCKFDNETIYLLNPHKKYNELSHGSKLSFMRSRGSKPYTLFGPRSLWIPLLENINFIPYQLLTLWALRIHNYLDFITLYSSLFYSLPQTLLKESILQTFWHLLSFRFSVYWWFAIKDLILWRYVACNLF